MPRHIMEPDPDLPAPTLTEVLWLAAFVLVITLLVAIAHA
jgi:hypothetical protein